MATVNKDFKVKNGLVVEGTTGTINGLDILTKKQADQDYIVNLIGGTATPENTPDTVVKRDGSGNFAANDITANEISIGEIGRIYDDGDLIISNTDGQDVIVEGDDIRLNATDDVRLSAGVGGNTSGDVVVGAAGKIRLESSDVFVGTDFNYPDSNRVATKGHVSDELANYTTTANLDSTVGSYGYLKSADLSDYATESYVDTAEADAVATAAADATSKANAAEAAANSYTDDEISALDLSLKAYADQAESDAVATAAADATAKANAAQAAAEAAAALDATDKADAAQAAAEAFATAADTTLYGTVTTDIATAKQQAISAAEDYTDAAVANLVDGAPALLDTLNELAAAIADNPNYATDVANLVATKADTSYVDAEISDLDTTLRSYADQAESDAVATAAADATAKANAAQAAAEAAAALDATDKADAAEAAAKSYTDAEITQEVADRNSAISSAINTEIADRNTAINAAIATEVIDRNSAITTAVNALTTSDIEEGTNLYFTNQRAIDAVGGTIGDAIDELTTDDIEEGFSNLYFTDLRARGSAGDLLAGATKSNIEISFVDGVLSIAAENGVADSTTDDLEEGDNNLYFTDARAVTALEAVTPNFEEVELNSVAKQVAATLSAPTSGIQSAFSWASADYRSAEFLVKVAYGTHTEVSKVLLTLDTSDNIAITEYAIVGTNGSASSISAGMSSGNVVLQVTTVNNNSTVTVVGTLLA